MKDLIVLLVRMMGLRGALVRYHRRRLRVALALMNQFGSDTLMPVWCSARFRHHQLALLRWGFLMKREFSLVRRAIRGPEIYREFCALMRARFPDASWSCQASGTRIIVVAPMSQISEWESFVYEYDLHTTK